MDFDRFLLFSHRYWVNCIHVEAAAGRVEIFVLHFVLLFYEILSLLVTQSAIRPLAISVATHTKPCFSFKAVVGLVGAQMHEFVGIDPLKLHRRSCCNIFQLVFRWLPLLRLFPWLLISVFRCLAMLPLLILFLIRLWSSWYFRNIGNIGHCSLPFLGLAILITVTNIIFTYFTVLAFLVILQFFCQILIAFNIVWK